MGDSSPVPLRPMSIGEIFDRATAVLLRHYRSFLAISLIVQVPAAALRYAAGAFFQSPNGIAAFSIAGFLTGAVASMAIAIAISRIARGEAARVRGALRAAVWNVPGTIGIGVAATLGFLVVAAPAMALRGGLRFGVTPLSTVFATVDAAIVVSAAALTFFLSILAVNALAVENAGAKEAIAKTVARVLAPGSLKRVAGASLAAVAAYGGLIFAATAAFGALTKSTHQLAPAVAGCTLAIALALPVLDVFTTICYFDLRVRREAYDVDASWAAMEAAHV